MSKTAQKMFTTAQICHRYDISRQRLWQISENRNLKPTMIGTRFAMWTPEMAEKLKPRPAPKKKPIEG